MTSQSSISFDTYLVGQGVEVPLPAELGVNETTAGQTLASLDNFQVWHVQFGMLDLEFFWGDHNTLLEERCVNQSAVLF